MVNKMFKGKNIQLTAEILMNIDINLLEKYLLSNHFEIKSTMEHIFNNEKSFQNNEFDITFMSERTYLLENLRLQISKNNFSLDKINQLLTDFSNSYIKYAMGVVILQFIEKFTDKLTIDQITKFINYIQKDEDFNTSIIIYLPYFINIFSNLIRNNVENNYIINFFNNYIYKYINLLQTQLLSTYYFLTQLLSTVYYKNILINEDLSIYYNTEHIQLKNKILSYE